MALRWTTAATATSRLVTSRRCIYGLSTDYLGPPKTAINKSGRDLVEVSKQLLGRPQLRYKSDSTPSSRRLGPILTYEQVEPLTREPSPSRLLIDVREPAETELGMIPSAVNIPLSQLPKAMNLSRPDFLKAYGFEKPTAGKGGQDIIVYCRSGMRSASALEMLKGMRYTRLSNYQGSWLDWTSRKEKKAGEE